MAIIERNAAIIQVDTKILLKMLDFEGGIIHRVFFPEEHWVPDVINIVLEHPDLDKVQDGIVLRKVTPTYQSTYGDNGCLIKTERIEPPKRKSVEN